MVIRLLAVDLDGTLLNSRSEISPANLEALVSAAARGVHVVVVTGRRYHSAQIFVERIPCPVTVISSNGARIGSASGEVHHRNFLPASVARRILETGRPYQQYAVAIFDVTGRGQAVMHAEAALEGPLGWYLRTAPEVLLQVSDLGAAVTCDPVQVMFGGPSDCIEPLESTLRLSPAGCSVHLTWTKYPARNLSLLDVMNQGCTKGAALSMWARRCGVAASEVMAIGDNHNDLEMLRFAGWPVLMANSSAGLKRDGWPVTLSNDEDGVAAAIREYVLQ